jgi:hypothetical protein
VTGGGSVLLDDEGAGADPADRELLMALDPNVLDRHLAGTGAPRPFAEEGHQPLNRPRGPLGMDEHAAVLRVAHPPHHAEPVGPPQRRVAISDALHGAAHDRPHRLRIRVPSLGHA